MNLAEVQEFKGEVITEIMLVAAAKLFSENYGFWGHLASEKMGPFAKQGARVRMSATKLREQVLPTGADNVYVRVLLEDELAGNVFGTRWIYKGRKMVWITQLCVSKKYRNQGIAKRLLENLRGDGCGFGILSSHPFAILAVLRVFGRGSTHRDIMLEMGKAHARSILHSCPVRYVKEAELHGSLFEEDVNDRTVSCADTNFWVDHEEPLEALKIITEKGIIWHFGELPQGHEFLVLINYKAEDEQEGLKISE